VHLKINNGEAHSVFSREMFLTPFDDFYEITMLERTHLLICHVPMEAWYAEQKWLDDLILANGNKTPEVFFKLPVNKVVVHFLLLLDIYLKEGIQSPNFYDIKRQELFYLLFFLYQKHNLACFLHCFLSNDIQFKKFVINNYLNARNVQELAKLANYSTSGFIKKFQKCFNESPYKWMQKQKAKQIFVEINRGIKSLQEIANEYKFSSYQHFSVFCKAQLGATPTTIFEKHKAKNE
jgi:AraC-like DNA-binding protein